MNNTAASTDIILELCPGQPLAVLEEILRKLPADKQGSARVIYLSVLTSVVAPLLTVTSIACESRDENYTACQMNQAPASRIMQPLSLRLQFEIFAMPRLLANASTKPVNVPATSISRQ